MYNRVQNRLIKMQFDAAQKTYARNGTAGIYLHNHRGIFVCKNKTTIGSQAVYTDLTFAAAIVAFEPRNFFLLFYRLIFPNVASLWLIKLFLSSVEIFSPADEMTSRTTQF